MQKEFRTELTEKKENKKILSAQRKTSLRLSALACEFSFSLLPLCENNLCTKYNSYNSQKFV